MELTLDGQQSTLKHIFVIFNQNSGKDKKRISKPALTVLLSEAGFKPTVCDVEEINEIHFNESALRKYYLIIAAGGDGTVRTVASYMIGKHLPLGIIPLGTFNHLAKDLGYPDNLDECVNIIKNGHIKPIDVGQVNDYIFLNNSSIGLYPKAVRYRRKIPLFVKWIKTTLALALMLKNFPLYTVKFRANNKEGQIQTPLIFISNNLYKLNLLDFTKRETLNEGRLYLYINHAYTRAKFLTLIIYFFLFRTKKFLGLFEIMPVEHCELTFSKHKIDVAVDGEVITLNSPLIYRIISQQLLIIQA